jgi:hypothetical protein
MTTLDETKAKADELGQMQNTILDLLNKCVIEYKSYSEFSTIKMGLSNAFKEINSIRLKVVIGDKPEKKEEKNGN